MQQGFYKGKTRTYKARNKKLHKERHMQQGLHKEGHMLYLV
jgi:hypothetical protein